MATFLGTQGQAARPVSRPALLEGAGNIFRKEVQEWFRTRRFLIMTAVSTLLAGAVPVAVFLNEGGLEDGRVRLSDGAYDGMMFAWLMLSLTLGAYLLVALTAGVLAKEEEAGTAQWLFSKPLSRPGYGLAKWAANSAAAILGAVLVPSAVYLGLLQAVAGVRDWDGVLLAVTLVALHTAVLIAIVLALSMVFNSTAAIAGVGIALGFLPLVLGQQVDGKLVGMFPMAIFAPAVQAARGEHVGPWQPVVAGLVIMVLSLVFTCHRLTRRQLS